jgi:hypothetical protein
MSITLLQGPLCGTVFPDDGTWKEDEEKVFQIAHEEFKYEPNTAPVPVNVHYTVGMTSRGFATYRREGDLAHWVVDP